MQVLLFILLLPAQLVDSKEFSEKAQIGALGATVRIVNVTRNAEGSGTVVRKNGPFYYILTANHLVEGSEKLEIQTFSADSKPKPRNVYRSGQVIAQMKNADLAVIRLATDDQLPKPLPICPPRLVPTEKAFPALAVGCTAGKDHPICLTDQVQGKKLVRKKEGEKPAFFWEMTKRIDAGRSGGPLLDKRGYLVGILSASSGEAGYCSHIDEIHNFLKRNALDWLYEENEKK